MTPTDTRHSRHTSSQRQQKRSKHEGPSDRSAEVVASTSIIFDDDPSPEPYIPETPLSTANSIPPFLEKPKASGQAKPFEALPKGTAVSLRNLSVRTDLNGRCGNIDHYDELSERYLVSLSTSSIVKVRPANVIRLSSYGRDLKVFLNFHCLARASLFTSLAATKAFEYQLDQRSQQGVFCDYVRVPLFQDKLDRFFDNYAVVEKRQGLTVFLDTICALYQVHLITDMTKFVATAIMKAAMSPLLKTDKHSFCNAKTYWTDRCGINVEYRQVMNLPKTFASVCKEEMPAATPFQLLSSGPTAQQWERTVLVDSTLMNHVSRPANGILVPEFATYKSQHDAEKDNALHDVAFLLRDLAPTEIGVQKVLAERFNLSTRLQEEHGTFCEQYRHPWSLTFN
jgi:NLI interacting factor-like phosphatase